MMNKIEAYIKKLCPKGVKYIALCYVAMISNGKDHKEIPEGDYPVYGSGGIMRYANKYIYNEESVLIPRKGSIGNIFYVDKPFWTVDTIFYTKIDKKVITPKFLYYFLKTLNLIDLNFAGGVPSLTKSILDKILIPIPPLPIQQEIVNILDKFTQLEAELVAELEARKVQFEYYRNEILNFKQEQVSWKKLGDVMTITRGASPRPIQNFLTDDSISGIPWIKIGDVGISSKYVKSTKQRITVEGAKKSKNLKKGDFILSNSMSFGRPYILDIDGCIHDGWISMKNFDQFFNPDFLYHLLNSRSVQMNWQQKASSGTVQNLNIDIVKETIVPLPPINEQIRIAAILDKLDQITNDLNIGLPAEIEARKIQYEYYRNKLLTFKPLQNG